MKTIIILIIAPLALYYLVKEMKEPDVCDNCKQDCTKCPYENNY